MKIIDPHLHFFDLANGDYHWLKAENPPFWPDKSVINKDFGIDDLSLSTPLELTGFVHIEAGFDNLAPEREISWLEGQISRLNPSIAFKSIAGFDLTSPVKENQKLINKLKTFNSFVGVRHILDDDAVQVLSHANCQANLELLNSHQLIFEAQLPVQQTDGVNALVALIESHRQVSFIVNHAGFAPDLSAKHDYQQWLKNLKKLSSLDNCAIKCSGWEMINRYYSIAQIRQVINDVIALFNEDRVMLASNFPLTLFAKPYQQLWQDYCQLSPPSTIPTALLDKLLHKNAQRIYRFE